MDKKRSYLYSDLQNISDKNFGKTAKELLIRQKQDWPQLSDGYNSLESIEFKVFEFDGFTIKVQYNPGRFVSSSARVDKKSIEERKCFLCPANLPPEQKGVPYNDYLILCNPYPIFPEHFTIPSFKHIPQQIKGNFNSYVQLARDISKYYTVLYNGPRCGASAPDHLHFQAGTKYYMPVETEYLNIKERFGSKIYSDEQISLYIIDDKLRKFLALESQDEEELEKYFNIIYRSLESLSGSGQEPMMNILSSYEEASGWRILLFPREKHRPSHYFAEGSDNILLSPGAVDIGGICITPLQKDYDKLTKNNIIEIFSEVMFIKEKMKDLEKKIIENLK